MPALTQLRVVQQCGERTCSGVQYHNTMIDIDYRSYFVTQLFILVSLYTVIIVLQLKIIDNNSNGAAN